MTEHTTNESTQEIPYGYCHCGCGEKTAIARQNETASGLVKGQPLRFVNGHNSRLRARMSVEQSFFSKVKIGKENECWIWTAGRTTWGYGHFGVNGKDYRAHRVAYELHHGPIPNGMFVCHTCDNPPCCNWNHLFLGTNADNVADMMNKNRQHRGEKTGGAKLTAVDVLEMRRLHTEGMANRDIERQFNMSSGSVYSIVNRISWKHI